MSNSTTSTGPGDAFADLASSLLKKPPSHSHTGTNNHDTNAGARENSAASTRAMSHTGAWKPALDRRQSWNAQEYKHDLLKRQYMSGEEGAASKMGGFSES
ncbi:hypothetical protein P885DRAFT_81268 [Corynascus similis CBS 632.67]